MKIKRGGTVFKTYEIMKTISINLYEFKELSEKAQQKAIKNLSSINVDYEWWEHLKEDAKNIGLDITEFDLDRNRHAKGEFCSIEKFDNPNAYDTAKKIMSEHGEVCGTYKLAESFLKDYADFEAKSGDDNNPFNKDVSDFEDTENDFLNDLLSEYAIMLQNEYDYLTSEKAIIETIEANEYTFEADGTLNNG